MSSEYLRGQTFPSHNARAQYLPTRRRIVTKKFLSKPAERSAFAIGRVCVDRMHLKCMPLIRRVCSQGPAPAYTTIIATSARPESRLKQTSDSSVSL
jgi:hypothetical protein